MAPKISGVLGSIGYPAPFHRLSEIDTDKVDARGEGEGVRRLEGEGARSEVGRGLVGLRGWWRGWGEEKGRGWRLDGMVEWRRVQSQRRTGKYV